MYPLLVCSYFAVSLVALAICVAVIVRDYKKEEFRDIANAFLPVRIYFALVGSLFSANALETTASKQTP